LIHHTRIDGTPYPLEECPIYRVMRSGAGCRLDTEVFWRRDGSSFPVEYSSYPLPGAHGEPEGAVVTFRDITERNTSRRELVQQAERLAKSEEQARRDADVLNAVLASIAEGVVVADERGHFVHFNAAAARILGRGATDSAPDEWSKEYGVFRPDGMTPYPPEELPLPRAMRGESVDETELFIHHPGQPAGVRVTISGRPLVIGGKLRGGVVVFRDDSVRLTAEARLKEYAEQLARSNAELQQFAYVASHDLQEPLRMVASYTQLLGERYRGKLDADADEFIGYAVDGAKRMQSLINDLLTYARVGTREAAFEPTDCNAVLDHALRNLTIAMEESGAVVTRDPLPTVRGDATQLIQLFQNMIGNAIKFVRESPPRVHISARRQGIEWLFSVRDNGIGIPESALDRVFIIFHRLHGRSEYGGTGIGLAICKRTVARHGGRIWVTSELGKGSTFWFTLPAEANE
jgi:signal transduction histidine kinase